MSYRNFKRFMETYRERKDPLVNLSEFLFESFLKSETVRIGKELKVDFDQVSFEEFHKGLNVELEHSDVSKDPLVFGKIALSHLKELPDYYTKLDKMETGDK